jgi:hypothetical protein
MKRSGRAEPDAEAARGTAPRRGRASVAPGRLQLFEVGLVAIGSFAAVVFNGVAMAIAIAVAVVSAVLVFSTRGPIGVTKRLSPRVNAAILALFGFVLIVSPAAFGWARSAKPIAVCEIGGVLIGCAIWLSIRPGPVVAPTPQPERPLASKPLRAVSRTAGRAAGRHGSKVSAKVPIAARWAGRTAGSLVRRVR